MASLTDLTVTMETKKGIFYKLIEYKPFVYLLNLLPYRWIMWLAVKSIKCKVGKYWFRLPASVIK